MKGPPLPPALSSLEGRRGRNSPGPSSTSVLNSTRFICALPEGLFSDSRSFKLEMSQHLCNNRQSTMKNLCTVQSGPANGLLPSAAGNYKRHAFVPSVMLGLAVALSAFGDEPADGHHDAYGPLYKASPHP